MAEQTSEQPLATGLGRELSLCRQRGLDDLDAHLHNQPSVPAPELERLARLYCEAKELSAYGRAAQIRVLIQDGLTAYGERGNAAERQFIAILFFDPSHSTPKKPPSKLLAEARAASGLDENRFRDYRRSMFARFDDFLVTFVAETASQAAGVADAGTSQATTSRPPRLTWLSAGGIIGLLVVGGVLAAGLFTSKQGNAPNQNPPASSPLPHTPSPTVSASPYIPGKTYTEQTGQYGSGTFTDPHNPSVSGIRIEAFQKVQVACKVLAPTIPSVSPDGYWYRIASRPWNNDYYAPAVNFENGDTIGGPALHNTDFRVSNCPG